MRNSRKLRDWEEGAVWKLQPKVEQTVQQHNSYEFIWIRRTSWHVTIFSWMFTITYSLVVGLWLGFGLGLDLQCLVGKLLWTRICATLGSNCHGSRRKPKQSQLSYLKFSMLKPSALRCTYAEAQAEAAPTCTQWVRVWSTLYAHTLWYSHIVWT